MTLLPYNAFNPWREVSRFFGTPEYKTSWTPRFDITETDKAFVLRGDLPGVTQKDVEVRIDEGLLSVSGERKPTADEERFSRRERPSGKFARRFWLPDTVDADGIKASYADGVLELTLPKQDPPDNARLIQVN